MTPASDDPIAPLCPRCGYDQTGALTAMVDVCPLESVCVECGLRFRWVELTSGRLSGPTWLVEHAPLRRLPLALATTLVVAPIGMVLWKALRLPHPIASGRLLLLVVASIVGCWLVVTGPLLLQSHRAVERLAGGLGPAYPIPASTRGGIFLHSLVLPLSDRPHRFAVSAAQNMGPDRVCTLAPPRRMWTDAVSPVLAAAFGLSFVAAMGSAIAFVALPFARRRAKVHARHLARCLVYLLATLPLAALAILLLQPPMPWWAPRSGASVAIALFEDPRMLGAWSIWLVPWWWAAARRYLRMERAWLVALATSVVGILVAGAAAIVWP